MLKNRIFIVTMCFASLQLLQFAQNKSYAKVDKLIESYDDNFTGYDQGPGAEKSEEEKKYRYEYIYEDPTNQSLSHLYFGIGLYKTDNDWAINEFLKLNECDLYNKYSSDTLEWKNVVDATKSYIEANKKDFPTRFEFPVPILLDGYDQKTKTFTVRDGYTIESLRRFELYSSNYKDDTCLENARLGSSLPRAVVLEYSRPFTLSKVPMSPQKASDFIKERLKEAKSTYVNLTEEKTAQFKDVYLFMNVKVFTHGKILGLSQRDVMTVQLMGILEGYAIYEDIDKRNLIYEHVFISNRRPEGGGRVNVALKDQYEILREKSKGAGILH